MLEFYDLRSASFISAYCADGIEQMKEECFGNDQLSGTSSIWAKMVNLLNLKETNQPDELCQAVTVVNTGDD